MNYKKLIKNLYSHQYEVIVITISMLILIIGLFAIGLITLPIVLIIDVIVLIGPEILDKIQKKNKKEKKGSDEDLKKKSSNLKKTEEKKVVKHKKEKTETKKKKKKGKILKIFLLFIIICCILGMIAICAFFAYIAKNAPSFNPDELYSQESTILYANDGETIIAKLGSQKREKITYNDIPEVFIDALIATEDSRFFQHNGFDFPRFIKASIGQVLGHSNAGGASTLTMQISKNAFTSTEDEGIQGIIRKFTDIYLSIFEIEKKYSKEEIIEFYVNNNLLGGNNYGIEQASLTYFGHSAKDMNLSEAALLAGMFQSPNAYNPLTKPENAAYRRSVVLKLMVRHGYITQEQADAANAIPIENLTKNAGGTGDDTEYQGFVDTVVSEIKVDTGLNPYTTAMKIYTTLDINKQNVINDVFSGKTFWWENDKVQAGVAVLDTKTGAILAVGTNRDSSASGLLNHATFENQTKRQIGSTAKPLYDYGPAIEYNNASPALLVGDEEYQYSDGNPINNFDGGYQGLITYRTALAGSRNIPALKVFKSVKKSQVLQFVKSLGLTPEESGGSLHEAHSIGGYNGESPLTIAAAYAAIGNMGVYNKTYSYTKIIYRDTNEEYYKEMESHRVMSEESAYILNDMLITTAQTGMGSWGYVRGLTFGAKTGTSNFSEETKKANGLSDIAINDLWIAGITDEVTFSIWYGYDKIYKDAYTVFGNARHLEMFRTIGSQVWSRSTQFTKPSGVISVEIESGCVDLKLPSAYTPSNMRTTELFKAGSEPTEVSTRFAQLSNVTNLKASSSNGEITLSWTEVEVDWLKKEYIDEYLKPVLTNDNFRQAEVNSRMNWNNSNLGTVGYDIYKVEDDETYTLIGTSTTDSYTFEPDTSLSAEYVVKTAYTKYKANESKGVTVSAKVNGTPVYNIEVKDATLTNGEKYDYTTNVTLSSRACELTRITIGNNVYTSWDEANTDIALLNAGTYTLKAMYTCGISKKQIMGSGRLTIKRTDGQ